MIRKKPYKHMPIIYFDDIMLRTIKTKDYKDLYAYGTDNEVVRFLSWGPLVSPLEAKKTIKQIFYPRYKLSLPRGYAIIDTKLNKMIGTVDFHSKVFNQNIVELGYALHKDYWHQGIMTKAVKELIKLGFEYLNYDKIIVKHLGQNIGSKKVILKSGFTYVKKEPYVLEKRTHVISDDMLTYEITKEQYDGNK
ncbi:MAG: GNAT family N-acetyltransferase [Acholeplasmataceae bacterium]